MQLFKSKLTRLRSMFDRLPDSGDAYGYAGITKQMLLSTVDGIYAHGSDIHESDENRTLARMEVSGRRTIASAGSKGLWKFRPTCRAETCRSENADTGVMPG